MSSSWRLTDTFFNFIQAKTILGRGRQNATAFDMLPWQMHPGATHPEGPPLNSTVLPRGRGSIARCSLAKDGPSAMAVAEGGGAFWRLDAPRRHQICPYPYTCTALMLANCLLHRRGQSRRRQSPLRARTSALHECAMPALVHRAHQPCTFLHLPCPYLRASSVCARLPCFLCLHRFESSASCIRSARWVYTGAPTHLGTCVPLLCDIQQTLGVYTFQ